MAVSGPCASDIGARIVSSGFPAIGTTGPFGSRPDGVDRVRRRRPGDSPAAAQKRTTVRTRSDWRWSDRPCAGSRAGTRRRIGPLRPRGAIGFVVAKKRRLAMSAAVHAPAMRLKDSRRPIQRGRSASAALELLSTISSIHTPPKVGTFCPGNLMPSEETLDLDEIFGDARVPDPARPKRRGGLVRLGVSRRRFPAKGLSREGNISVGINDAGA